jgi:ketosteroid isomerase-like protein
MRTMILQIDDWRLKIGVTLRRPIRTGTREGRAVRQEKRGHMTWGSRTIAAIVGAALVGVVASAQTPDTRAGAAAIMKADRDFNQALAERNLARFLSFVAEAATFGGGTRSEVHGRDAVSKDWAPFFAADGPKLAWTPTKGEVIGGGDLGYTVGTWELRAPIKPAANVANGSNGASTGPAGVTRGNYLTVWKKQADGAWQAVFDTGSTFPSTK